MTKSSWNNNRPHPKNDPRSVDELISAALGEQDEDVAWEAVCTLHWRGSLEVLGKAGQLCRSRCEVERRLGANILGQLGVPDRTFPTDCLEMLFGMLESERDAGVLRAILIALGHLGRREVIQAALPFRNHADPDVRDGVVMALMGHEDDGAVKALIALSNDVDAHIRDWATFALGTQLELDTPELREALAERLTDPDDDARAEAMVGLAARGDARAVAAISEALSAECVGTLAVEAAELTRNPVLCEKLIALREWWDVSERTLENAIRACSPERSE